MAALNARWQRVAAAVLLVVAALLAAPYAFLLTFDGRVGPWYIAIFCAAAAYAASGRRLDAFIYAATLLLCAALVEPDAAPQLLAAVSMLVLAVTGRVRTAFVAGVSTLAVLLAAIHVKQQFAGSVLTWQDARYFFARFADNVGVMATQPVVLAWCAGAAAIVVIAMGLAMRGDRAGAANAGCLRFVGRGLALVLAFVTLHQLHAGAEQASRAGPWKLGDGGHRRPVASFLSTLYLEPHAEYRAVETRDFSERVRQLMAANAHVAAPRRADIVLFLQESQFDPRAIATCPAALCASNVFNAQATTTDLGELRVHVTGGGTWLTEFELQTGLPHDLYGPAGDFAPFNVAPGVQRSFVRSLKAAGYYTVALYPTSGGLMNGREAYRAYGFDEFVDAKEAGLPGIFGTADREVHRAALGILERARRHGKPVFLLALTIFNHADHGHWMERVPQALVDDAGKVFPDRADADNLADYVWRTREFASAYEATRASVLGASRPAVIAWFGDHQPPFGGAPALRAAIRSRSTPPLPARQFSWYEIDRNFGDRVDAGAQPLDIVFLGGLLAERAGVPLDEWLAANVQARERCMRLLAECAVPQVRDAYFTYLLRDLQATSQ